MQKIAVRVRACVRVCVCFDFSILISCFLARFVIYMIMCYIFYKPRDRVISDKRKPSTFTRLHLWPVFGPRPFQIQDSDWAVLYDNVTWQSYGNALVSKDAPATSVRTLNFL